MHGGPRGREEKGKEGGGGRSKRGKEERRWIAEGYGTTKERKKEREKDGGMEEEGGVR